ncbi:MAG: sulfurtransferase TusA family protein [Candidatus Poseidoniaceae archaeon]|nr:sulfurtransferase TusA family protein [Candidatus Poseidoniaceae archaeon]
MVEVSRVSADAQNEPTHRLNVIGFHCPIPIAELKKALQNMKGGDILEVLSDDPETCHDIPLLLMRLNHNLISIEDNAGEHKFIIEVKQ